jgi:dTDP-glucose 4,6-dehydratase
VSTLLLTGGAGFIGSALVRTLIGRTDHVVVNLDKLTYAGHRLSLGAADTHPRHHFVQGDIADAALVKELFARWRFDGVIHLAAESHVDRSIDGPAVFIQTNVVGTTVLLEEATRFWRTLGEDARSAFRFLHVSTDEVFGSLGPTGRFDEETPYQPNSPYSASKAASDHLVRAWYHTYGLPTLVSNCSNNYGPYQFPEKLIPLVTLNGLEGRKLPVYGTGANVRDWLFVEDHVSALLAIFDRGRPGQTYCVSGSAEKTNLDVVRAICAILDEVAPNPTLDSHDQLIEYVADRPGHDLRYAVDATKLRTELAWSPTESFATGLRRTVKWYMANADSWCAAVSESYRRERLGRRVFA